MHDLAPGPSLGSVVTNWIRLGKTLRTAFTPRSRWHHLPNFPHIASLQLLHTEAVVRRQTLPYIFGLQHPTSCPSR
jgi:hypothetical protein